MLAFEHSQRAAVRVGLREALQLVAPAYGAKNHDRLWMPAVRLHRDGCRVIGSNRENVRLFLQQNWQGAVNFFDDSHLLIKVTIFSCHVSSLNMNKKIIEMVMLSQIGFKLFLG